ncbi:hypothetical protein DRF65_14140 [Chryseobacterium pennae]|uniref:Uncharacterized protein n=1 Tax=Chryseobacterium pennae TaxID=2258962 RepID=A0A3D9C7J7_9FLAO|nr:hypothetical protein [Chryseobacterium pennae]REC61867.1 hypothetical protein DRF65_14140 [Chryseobacterium pennae]
MKANFKTKVSLDNFKGSNVGDSEKKFADNAVSLLTEIVNDEKFLSGVKEAKFSYSTLYDDNGKYVKVNNDQILEIINTGKERKTLPDNTINLLIILDDSLGGSTVGEVNPGDPTIRTNVSFFNYWIKKDDYLSLAAHWIHEWLHVAGIYHKGRRVDANDVNYTIGKIAVEIGKSLIVKSKKGSKKRKDSAGQGYIDAMDNFYKSQRQLADASGVAIAPSQNALRLGFVDFGTDSRPVLGKAYPVISAADQKLEDLSFPTSTLKALKLDVNAFYNDHLPDFWGGTKEGLFKISINTRNPTAPASGGENEVTNLVDFKVKDGNYASGFLFKGIFRNVMFADYINLKFDLFELDTDAEVYYNKIKGVFDSVPELKTLDILNGIPYLSLATKMFEGIIKTFGKNANDHIWKEMPLLEINPSIGGAFLRNGLYVIFEQINSKMETITFEDLQYKDEFLEIKDKRKSRMSNHLILNIRTTSSDQSL